MTSTTINPRWIAKKAARTGVAIGSLGTGRLARSGASQPRVLTYHRFGDIAYDPYCIAPGVFARQMEALAESGRAVSLADVEGCLFDGGTLPSGALLVTIDDGYRSTYARALPDPS